MGQNGQWRIIVADDDLRMLDALCAALNSEWPDAEVIGVVNGTEVTQEVYRREGAVDLLILDLLMPEKGGLAALSEVRARFPDVPAIAVTGGFGSLAPEEAIHMITFIGASAVLQKPFTGEELVGAVREMLTGSGRHGRADSLPHEEGSKGHDQTPCCCR